MADKDLHARLVVHDIEDMSKEDIKRLQSWLRSQAMAINTTNQKEYHRKFTARLFK